MEVTFYPEQLAAIEQQTRDFDEDSKWFVIGNIYENPELISSQSNPKTATP